MRTQTFPLPIVLLLGLAAAAVWVWAITPSVFSFGDVEVSGPVVAWQEQEWENPKASGGGKADHFLDLHLEKSLLLYRVAPAGYESHFKREDFLKHMKPGTLLTLTVAKSELDSPSKTGNVLTIEPVVHVRGLRDAQQVYFARDDFYNATNHYRWVKMAVAALLTAFFVFTLMQVRRRETKAPARA